jgi:uncharacterized protein (DUF305 family)
MKRQLTLCLSTAAVTIIVGLGLAACGGEHGGGHSGSQPTPAASAPTNANANAADIKFATDMIPHHQQAVAMAEVAETRASNPGVKQLAAKIKQAQDPEIKTMSDWLRQWGAPVPSMSSGGHGGHGGMPGLMSDDEMKQLMAASGRDFDRMFLEMMIRHHQGAIEMATTELQQGSNPQAKQLAQQIATSQAAEVRQMQDLLAKL